MNASCNTYNTVYSEIQCCENVQLFSWMLNSTTQPQTPIGRHTDHEPPGEAPSVHNSPTATVTVRFGLSANRTRLGHVLNFKIIGAAGAFSKLLEPDVGKTLCILGRPTSVEDFAFSQEVHFLRKRMEI